MTRTLRHLALTLQRGALALLLLVLVSGPGGFWECQNRICSTTLWACCCLSRQDARIDSSDVAASPVTPHGVAFTELRTSHGHCDCSRVTLHVNVQRSHFVPLPLAIIAFLPKFPAPTLAVKNTLLRAVDLRGPPSLLLVCAALRRGPPVS